ncbi:MAG TPA: tetratricopeptide repeat protein [Verrucomicrobiae bacterium]|nr:tetratricopeptide repeat protein [Verrucomicrobiae bacterium]
MLRRCLLSLTLAVASVLLATGCKTVSSEVAEYQQERDIQRLAEAHAHYALGLVHDLNDESVLALDEYYAAAMLDPGDEELILEASRRFLLNKQPDMALEILTRAIKQPNASGALYGRLGIIYSQLGELDLAVNASRMAIKKDPQELVGYQNLFVSYLDNKQPQLALDALNEAAQVTNTDVEFITGLTELYLNFGMQTPSLRTNANARARIVLTGVLKFKPFAQETELRVADDFAMLNDTEHAAELYRDLLTQETLEVDVRETIRAKLADIYMREENHRRALDQLEAIIKDDPANARVYYYLGSLAFDQNEMTNAADYFSKTIMLQPGFEAAYYDLASAQINMDQPLTALSTLAKARAQNFPDSFMLEYLSGVIYSGETNFSQALTCFTTAEIVASVKEPERLTAPFYFQIGATCERLGKIEDAEKYFEKSLALRPNDDETLNYLGFMWADHGIKLNQAREYIARALQADPASAAYLDSMGWVLFKLGKTHEALAYILRANAASDEPDAELMDHLGDIYSALNQPDKARESWQKSVELEPNETVQKKLAPATKK